MALYKGKYATDVTIDTRTPVQRDKRRHVLPAQFVYGDKTIYLFFYETERFFDQNHIYIEPGSEIISESGQHFECVKQFPLPFWKKNMTYIVKALDPLPFREKSPEMQKVRILSAEYRQGIRREKTFDGQVVNLGNVIYIILDQTKRYLQQQNFPIPKDSLASVCGDSLYTRHDQTITPTMKHHIVIYAS